MKKITLLSALLTIMYVANAQIYLASNGLTSSGSGASTTVALGGTLDNAATSIDFGSANASSSFLFKKGTSNYFFIGNNGKVGIGNVAPAQALDVTGTINTSAGFSYGGTIGGTINTYGTYASFQSNTSTDALELFTKKSASRIMFRVNNGARGIIMDGFSTNFLFMGGSGETLGGIGNANGTGHLTFLYSTAGNSYTEGARLTNSGNLGIGMTTPSARLTVYGSGGTSAIFRDIGTGAGSIQVENGNGYYANWGVEGSGIVSFKSNSTAFLYGTSAGNVGIGTNAPNSNAKLDVNGNIFSSGKIAIGTNDMAKISTYSLAVNGDAIFNKVKVKLYANWPDYVFYKNYELIPLADVEKYILQNNHLPGVPSAMEVEKDGLDIGDNQATLLKKIEELTLYIIDQNKKIEEQQQKIKTLQQQQDVIKSLQQDLEKIKEQLRSAK